MVSTKIADYGEQRPANHTPPSPYTSKAAYACQIAVLDGDDAKLPLHWTRARRSFCAGGRRSAAREGGRSCPPKKLAHHTTGALTCPCSSGTGIDQSVQHGSSHRMYSKLFVYFECTCRLIRYLRYEHSRSIPYQYQSSRIQIASANKASAGAATNGRRPSPSSQTAFQCLCCAT